MSYNAMILFVCLIIVSHFNSYHVFLFSEDVNLERVPYTPLLDNCAPRHCLISAHFTHHFRFLLAFFHPSCCMPHAYTN